MNYPQQLSGISYRIWGLVGVLILALSFFLIYSGSEASVSVYKKDGTVRVFEGKIIKDMTVLDAIVAASQVGRFEFNYSIEGNKLHINRLDTFIDGLGPDINIKLNGKDLDYDTEFTKKISPRDRIDIRL